MDTIPRLVIAGTSSGVGKTTVATALMAALKRRGPRVQPFKVGPDYIDPSYHVAATGVPSRNLDSWMVPADALLELFTRACRGADVAVVEGVMGLFDGASGRDESGSTAQMAKLLDAPVVVVLNVAKMARSAAALAFGYARFDPALRVEGFILNGVASESHYRWVREAIESAAVGPVLGYIPSDPHLKLPERHLGLIPTGETALPEGFLDRLVQLVETHIDLEAVLAIARSSQAPATKVAGYQNEARLRGLGPDLTREGGFRTGSPRFQPPGTLFPAEPISPKAVIAVARDEAFNFYYQDNLDLLEAHGARLLPFSPLRDAAISEGVDALYVGGGFPELHAESLAANRPMLESVRRAVEAGVPTYAECGGLMYLCQGIVDGEGVRYPMVGAVPGWCSMEKARLNLGYVEVSSARGTVLGPAGTRARGHEFHWTRWEGPESPTTAYRVLNQGERPEGYARDNLLATFVHLHFGANPALAPAFVESARAYRRLR